jgi:hypothetical protein
MTESDTDYQPSMSIDITTANKPPATAASIMDIINSQQKHVL